MLNAVDPINENPLKILRYLFVTKWKTEVWQNHENWKTKWKKNVIKAKLTNYINERLIIKFENK